MSVRVCVCLALFADSSYASSLVLVVGLLVGSSNDGGRREGETKKKKLIRVSQKKVGGEPPS